MRYLMLLFILNFTSLLYATEEDFGIALALEGEVYVARGGEDGTLEMDFEAKVEENFFFNDTIETGEDGSLQVSFNSSFLSIGPNTILQLQRKKGKNGEDLIIISLEEGKFRSKINDLSLNQYFEVRTDRGNLRVHGTDFVTEYDPENGDKFAVSVLEGKVGIAQNTEGDATDTGDESAGADVANDSSSGGADTKEGNDNSPNDNTDEGVVNTSDTPTERLLVDESVNDDNPIVNDENQDLNKPIFLNTNETSGFTDSGPEELSNLTLGDVESLKSKFPMPGDDEQESLTLLDLGIKEVLIDEVASNVSREIQTVLEITQPASTNPVTEEITTINDQTNSGFRINFTIDTSR
jgi:hypothetical protein